MLIWYIVTYILDAIAIGLSIYSAVSSYKSTKKLATAIKDLHESHIEMHELVKKIEGNDYGLFI